MSESHYISATEQWVDDVVIHHNFCPFAKFVRHPNKIKYVVETGDAGDIVATLYNECKFLDETPSTATTLVIAVSTSTDTFDDYLDVLGLAEQLLADWGYSGVYQLASFHPHYVFSGEDATSPSNYTNRSPYPLFHLIRESDIAKYMKNEDDGEKIYAHNIARAESLGCKHFETQLKKLQQK